jgi:hypothetical protein
MAAMIQTTQLQDAIDRVEALSIDDQEVLLDLVGSRLRDKRREELIQEVAEARADYAAGRAFPSTVEEIMARVKP